AYLSSSSLYLFNWCCLPFTIVATFVVKSVLRSAATSGRAAAIKFASGAKPKVAPFRIPTQKSLTARIFKSPVEISCVRVESMFPYHTATASTLLTSMLSATPRSYGWTLEEYNDDA
ncbi:hypothetical protein HAX54_025530, partial [Datura stramonium]|nr:hypothetical protein [Datura stramonium]